MGECHRKSVNVNPNCSVLYVMLKGDDNSESISPFDVTLKGEESFKSISIGPYIERASFEFSSSLQITKGLNKRAILREMY